MKNNKKVKNFKGTLKKMLLEFKPYKKILVIAVVLAILSSVFTIIGPKILGKATTEIFDGIMKKIEGTGGINFEKILYILIILLVLYVMGTICSGIMSILTSDITQKMLCELREKISIKMNKLPLKYFDKMTNGEILSRVTNDIDTVCKNLNSILTRFIVSIVSVIGILIMMISISGYMTLAAFIAVPIMGVIVGVISKKSQGFFKKQQEYIGHVNGHVEEAYGGHTVIKVFNNEENSIKKFENFNNNLYESGWKSEFIAGLMTPIMLFVSNISYVLVSILGGYLAIISKIAVGDILAFIQYTKSFTQPLGDLAQIASLMQSTLAAYERVCEFLEEEEELDEGVIENVDSVEGSVEFRDIKFGYDKDKIVIDGFSVKVNKGSKVAIVGPTGAGKTTIVKLLMRFYNLNSGDIFIDGKNINSFEKSKIRSIFSMVLQDTWLFNGSILENIKYGTDTTKEEEIINAAKLAYAHHFIKSQDNGYNTIINEDGDNISSGQKQLITIARAILRNPKILILDEATSSVDTRTEKLIQGAMENLMKNRTTFIIAHRLSTIKNADIILVMNNGNIVEQGTHKELLEKGEFYAELYNSQFA